MNDEPEYDEHEAITEPGRYTHTVRADVTWIVMPRPGWMAWRP